MSENETANTDVTPPQVEPIAPPEAEGETPDVNPETAAAVGEPDGKSVDASEDPNLGHAFEDQAQGVGVGPTQTSADGEEAVSDAD